MAAPWVVYLDFETSGLDPLTCRPLEYGAIVVDSDNQVIAERTRLFRIANDDLIEVIRNAHPKVQEMHTNNGLWADLFAFRDQGVLLGDDFEAELDLLLQVCPNPRSAVLGGFSPHFDRGWLRHYAPKFESRISHRNLDISTLRHTVLQKFGAWEPSPEPVPHRGLGDCQRALAYYQWYLEYVMRSTA